MRPEQHLEQWLYAVFGREETRSMLARGSTVHELALKALVGEHAEPLIAQARESRLPPLPAIEP